MNLFLLIEWFDPTIIISNEEKIKRLEAENKTALAEVKRLDEKCKTLGRDSANVNTAVMALCTKVNKFRPSECPPSKPPPLVPRTVLPHERPTLRGLVTGTLKLGGQTEAQPVMGKELSKLVAHVEGASSAAQAVLLSSEDHVPFDRSLVEEDCLIITEDDWKLFPLSG
jgi:hypothetical protein